MIPLTLTLYARVIIVNISFLLTASVLCTEIFSSSAY